MKQVFMGFILLSISFAVFGQDLNLRVMPILAVSKQIDQYRHANYLNIIYDTLLSEDWTIIDSEDAKSRWLESETGTPLNQYIINSLQADLVLDISFDFSSRETSGNRIAETCKLSISPVSSIDGLKLENIAVIKKSSAINPADEYTYEDILANLALEQGLEEIKLLMEKYVLSRDNSLIEYTFTFQNIKSSDAIRKIQDTLAKLSLSTVSKNIFGSEYSIKLKTSGNIDALVRDALRLLKETFPLIILKEQVFSSFIFDFEI